MKIKTIHMITIIFFVIVIMVWIGAYLNENYSIVVTKQGEWNGAIYQELTSFFSTSYGQAYFMTCIAILVFMGILTERIAESNT